MDANQTKIIELLREVHLIAVKEIERLNLQIAEFENRHSHQEVTSVIPPSTNKPTSAPRQSEIEVMNDKQVAAYLNMSVSSLRRWRLFRKGPKFMKIGSAVRYKRGDVELWLNSCSESQ